MSDRYEEMTAMSRELEGLEMPESLNGTAGRVRKRIVRHRIGVGIKSAAATVCALMLVLFAGVNTSETFASTMADLPIVGELARIFSINHGAEDAFMMKYGTPVGQTEKFTYGGADYQVEMSYAMADGTTLEMFLKAAEGSGKKGSEIMLCPEWVEDLSTGERLEELATMSVSIETGADQSSSIITWKEYHRDIRVVFSLEQILADSEPIYKGWEQSENITLTYDIHLTRCDEPMEYEIAKEFTVCGGRYVVEKVVVYPLSTEVWIRGYEGSGSFTYAGLSTEDAKGKQRRDMGLYTANAGSKKSGIIAYGFEDGSVGGKYLVDSGYYAYPDEMYLNLGRFEILPDRLKEVRLDIAADVFMDADGVMEELKYISADEGDMTRIRMELERPFVPVNPDSMPLWFEEYGTDAEEIISRRSIDFTSSGQVMTGELWVEFDSLESMAGPDGYVHFKRCYPSDYEDVDMKIRIR